MKKILFFIVFFLFPIVVDAEDICLKDLVIKNGELSLPFDSYNNQYTVTLEEAEYRLDFDYKVEEGIVVSQFNNHDLENNSIVTLTLSKGEKTVNYTFHILKEVPEIITVFNNVSDIDNQGFVHKYKIYIIPTVCLMIIIISYKIIFRKHKKKII